MPSDVVLQGVVLGFAAVGLMTVLAAGCFLMLRFLWLLPALAALGALIAAPPWVHHTLGALVATGAVAAAGYFTLSYASGSRGRAMLVIAGLASLCVVLSVSA